MKKFIKTISLTMAIIMLVLALPIMGAARTLTTTEDNLSGPNGLPLIFSIDNLADTTNDAPNSDYKVTATHTQSVDDVSGNNITRTAGESAKGWMSYMHMTDIPLNETSQYVITFDATAEMAYRIFGFTFSGTNNNDARLVAYDSNKYYYIAVGMQWVGTDSGQLNPDTNPVVSNVSGTNKVCDMTKGLSHSYVMTINNKTVTLIRDGLQVYQYTVNTIAPNNAKYLTLGWRGRGNANVPSDGVVATMSNIKVYQGVYEQRTFNNYADGDVLLKMASPFTTDFESQFDDLTVSAVPSQNVHVSETDPTTLVADTPGGWMKSGVSTNIPLGEDAKYTVELYMKKHIEGADMKAGFCWSGTANNALQGIYTYEQSINSMGNNGNGYAEGIGQYGNVGNIKNLWTAYADKDGFTRIVIEINGYVSTVYVGGVKVGTLDVSEGGYVTNTLSLVVRNNVGTANVGENVVSVKDVTVYAGNIATNNKIQFVKEDKTVTTKYIAPNTVLNAEDFPALEETDKVVRWFYKGTNITVLAPYTVTNDAVIEAREVDATIYSSVVGMQYTAPAENEQSVRFIAGFYTLQASAAGFEVKAKYKDGDTVKDDKSWDVSSTKVYNSINAVENGTVRSVTAKELGATYLIALSVDEVPTNIGQIDFEVRSYITVDGTRMYSEWAYFTLNNGAASPDLMPLTK